MEEIPVAVLNKRVSQSFRSEPKIARAMKFLSIHYQVA